MKKVVFGAILGLMAAVLPAHAIATGKTIIRDDDLYLFDPVPGIIPQNVVDEVVRVADHIFTQHGDVDIIQAKVWRKAEKDGYVVCGAILDWPNPFDKTGKGALVAVSFTTSPFRTVVAQPIFDQEAYNLVGCNTPGFQRAANQN